MTLSIQQDIQTIRELNMLDTLLKDRTTGQHILWGTVAYTYLGNAYARFSEMQPDLVTGSSAKLITTWAQKNDEQRSTRTKQLGEVTTPQELCRKMCDYADTYLKADTAPQQYVDARVLEIVCGEAPFLTSRYDMTTGEILPVPERYGLVDRKLHIVSENAQTVQEWLAGATRAFQATYGYELQGDDLLIARINLFMSFREHMQARWGQTPDAADCKEISDIIAWNVWQMDGLAGAVPSDDVSQKMCNDNTSRKKAVGHANRITPRCRIRDWQTDCAYEFGCIDAQRPDAPPFALAIGNPPYQRNNAASTRKTPIYNAFMDATYTAANITVLVTPARFLFDAGQTPKRWNRKMLADPHFCVLEYIADATHFFPSAEIKGGIAITLHDNTRDMEPVTVFIPIEQMRGVVKKVAGREDFASLSTIVSSRGLYRFSAQLFADFPDAANRVGKGTKDQIVANIFTKNPDIFDRADIEDSLTILGRLDMQRTARHIDRRYVRPCTFLDTYNVLVPEANNAGSFGETLSMPVIAPPGTLCTDTFICIGQLASADEAQNLRKYLATKFVRSLLGLKKVTQHNAAGTWIYVPLQDFTAASDLDWSTPIAQIDAQLYAKYELEDEQICFIEANVKTME